MGTVVEVVDQPPGRRFTIDVGNLGLQDASVDHLSSDQSSSNDHPSIGDSICINGCCLTVVAIDSQLLDFEAGEETLSRTNLGELTLGSRVNLERSLAVGDRLGGHYVTGHVDTLGELIERAEDPPWANLRFSIPKHLASQVASKGSIAIDGISLTVVDVTDSSFTVALIPHTLSVTTLGQRRVGDKVNLETDVLAKYVQRSLGREATQHGV